MINFIRRLFGMKKAETPLKADMPLKADTPLENDVLTSAEKVGEVIVTAQESQYSKSIYNRNLAGVLTYEIETTSSDDNINKLHVCEFIEISEGRLTLGVRIKRDDDFLFKTHSGLFLSYSMHGESFSVEAKIIKTVKYNEKSADVPDAVDSDIPDKKSPDMPERNWIHCIVEIILCAEPTRHLRKHGRIVTEWNVYYRIESDEQGVASGVDDENPHYSVTKTIDISEGGFKSIVEKQLPANTRITCIVEVDNYKKSEGILIGRVIRCVPMLNNMELFEMTVQFVETAESVKEFLAGCIREIHPGPVDAEAKITISDDCYEAFIELSPPRNNGSDLSYETLCDLLTLEGVTFGIDNDVLISLSEKPRYNLEFVIARGVPPIHGEDAVLKFNVDINPMLAPREYDNGTVDFKDIGLIQPIKKGEVLVEKTLLTSGTPGTRVTGKIVEATPGKDKKLPAGAYAVVNETGTALLSGIDGYLSIIDGKINIVNTYMVKGDVHYETGNISHNGIVVVTGDVRRGFSVSATGDIVIHGTVESASIKAGGSLVVQGGCIGEDNVIEAGVNVACKFIDGGTFNIRGNLKTTYIINSTVRCGGAVDLIGNGIIRNSRIIARASVTAKFIGSQRVAADKTVIEVGNDPELLSRFVSISKEIEQLEKDIEAAETTIRTLTMLKYKSGLTNEKSQMLDKSKALIKRYIAQHSDMTEEYGDLKGRINELGHGIISVRDTAYEGLRIIIGSCTLVLNDSIRLVKFYRNNDEIALSSMGKR